MFEYTRVLRTIPLEDLNRIAAQGWVLVTSCSNFLYLHRPAAPDSADTDPTTAAALERGRQAGLFRPGSLYELLWFQDDNWFIGWNDARAGVLEIEDSGATLEAVIDSAIALKARRRNS